MMRYLLWHGFLAVLCFIAVASVHFRFDLVEMRLQKQDRTIAAYLNRSQEEAVNIQAWIIRRNLVELLSKPDERRTPCE